MSYYICLPSGNSFSVMAEQFLVRSNAEKFAKRMGWERYFIATAEQKSMMESGQPFSFGVTDVTENITTISPTITERPVVKDSKSKHKKNVSR